MVIASFGVPAEAGVQAGPVGATQHEGQGFDSSHRLQLPHGPRKGIFWKGKLSKVERFGPLRY